MANITSQKTKYLIKKWGKRIKMVEGVQGKAMSFEKRAALANSLESLNESLKFMESTNTGNIGQYKRYLREVSFA